MTKGCRNLPQYARVAWSAENVCAFASLSYAPPVSITDSIAGRSTGDSYDNALAESIIGLYKTEVILTGDN